MFWVKKLSNNCVIVSPSLMKNVNRHQLRDKSLYQSHSFPWTIFLCRSLKFGETVFAYIQKMNEFSNELGFGNFFEPRYIISFTQLLYIYFPPNSSRFARSLCYQASVMHDVVHILTQPMIQSIIPR